MSTIVDPPPDGKGYTPNPGCAPTCGAPYGPHHPSCTAAIAQREATRAAALGQAEWATWGSADHHRRYVSPLPSTSRRRCDCGCNKRATHVGCANGLAMTSGCEMSMRRWTRG